MTIWFVRHSQPEVVPGQPPRAWALSQEGRDRAELLGKRLVHALAGTRVEVFSSNEIKAIETAELLGLGPATVDDRFGEVTKPWFDDAADHRAAVGEYLSGSDRSQWEPRANALARFDAALQRVADIDVVVATHGTVLSLWMSQHVAGLDPVMFWLGLEMPDAWHLDGATGAVNRVA